MESNLKVCVADISNAFLHGKNIERTMIKTAPEFSGQERSGAFGRGSQRFSLKPEHNFAEDAKVARSRPRSTSSPVDTYPEPIDHPARPEQFKSVLGLYLLASSSDSSRPRPRFGRDRCREIVFGTNSHALTRTFDYLDHMHPTAPESWKENCQSYGLLLPL
jgi:hypothetical protein